MIRPLQPKRTLSFLLALALFILPALTSGTAAAEASGGFATGSPASPADHFDYFSHVYPNLNDPNHVLKTATYEDIVHLFESEGNFAVLIGGSWSANAQADIGYINEVAKQYGVSTIYNFDTKLDGESLDIADSSSPYAYKYVDLVNKYLKNLNLYDKADAAHNVSYVNKSGETVSANKVEAPFLFIYNKDHVDAGGNKAPIVAYLNESKSAADLQTGGVLDSAKVDAYKAQLQAVFSTVNSYNTYNESNYIKTSFNVNYAGENAGKPLIFTEGDEPLVLEHVTYHQLKQILASDGNYVFLFGGSWCPNTQAIIKYVNEYAKKNNVDKIYFFDTKLDAGLIVGDPANNSGTNSKTNPHNNNELQIRTTNHPYANLYVDLVKTYLTNIKTENNTAAKPSVISYVDANGSTVTGDRLQVPYLFAYNKNNVDANGQPAPILGHVELMYSWTNIQPDYVSTGYTDGARYTNAINALNSLYSRLEAVPSRLTGVAPTAAGAQDGQIAGTAGKALEYRSVTSAVYQPVNSGSITGLAPGAYVVRYASKAGYQGPTTAAGATAIPYPAGQSVTITVPDYVTFADVAASSWYNDAVGYLAARSIATGTDGTHFAPNAPVTRGQFTVLLLKALGIAPEAAGADNFADAGTGYYSGYLAAAKKLGIATGSGSNQFLPEQSLTREELFTLLYRALNALGQLPAQQTGTGLSGYSDAGQFAAFAQEAVQALSASGIVQGNGGKLEPKALTTRAQAAQVLYNLLSRS
ncbi:S-layer homology domain-containing protein [Paenibacillus sp. NFR01]|uniref:S-layer homology domain-containing protein n=1 Tax=Paenibacillus sp. NFR01 TaxID=1566279 RepID=UPI0008B0A39F|nr:S-layer homology domain-containing protein [Paenibacillus sp. NFR01]SEU01955.1 S-layer homology domain-containing protein [Paenibacillus sp. NFR01]